MSSYKERISKSKDDKKAATADRSAKQAAQQLKVDIFATETKIEDLKAKVEDAKEQVPFNANTVITVSRTLEAAEEDLKALNKLGKELFSEE